MAPKLTRHFIYLCVGVAILIVLAGCRMAPFDLDVSMSAIDDEAPSDLFLLTFDGNGNDGGTPPPANDYPEGHAVTLPGNIGSLTNTTPPGYTFIGWNTQADGLGTSYLVGSVFVMPPAPVRLYANWTDLPTYNVSYTALGADGGTQPNDPNNYLDGQTVTVRGTGTLFRTGYSLTGWDDGSFTYPVSTGTFSIPASDVILDPVWVPVATYTVTYDANAADSGTAPGNQTKTAGIDLTLETNSGVLAKTGSTFAGWNTQPDGLGVHYAEGAFYTDDANLNLYAEWAPITYTLTYDGNGHTAGAVPAAPTDYTDGDLITVLAPGSLERVQDGIQLRFTGWEKIGGGGGTVQPSDTFAMPAEAVTLRAIWDVIGGVGPAGGLVFYDKGVTSDGWRYLEAAPQSTEWTLKVWGGHGTEVTGADGTAVGTGKRNSIEVVNQFGATEPFEGKPDYAAKLAGDLSEGGYEDWFLPSKDELDLMYTDLHSASIGSFDDDYYWSSSEPDALKAWIQYFLDGSQYGTVSKTNSYRVRAARAFSSVAPTYLVIYAPNGADSGGVPVDVYHYAPGDTVTALSGAGTLALTGHTFTGWNTAADGSGVDYPVGATPTMPNANLVLYAQWAPLFAGGDGSFGNPYKINSPEGLDAIRLDLAADYELVADIDLGVPPWNSGAGWEPISTFSGTLEGNDKIIQNLFIDRTTGVGLFDNTQGATIRNLILDNVNIFASSGWAGAIAGRTDSVGGGTTIVNVSAAGTVTGGQQLGGLVGLGQNLTLTNSFAEVDVVSSADSVGGLVGRFTGTGTIENSYALGSVNGVDSVGGLVGLLDGTVTNTFAAGTVSGSSNVGGLVGTNTGTVNDSYYDQDTTGQTTGAGTGYSTTQMMIQGNYPAWDFAVIWDIVGGVTYPFLR